MAELFPQDYVSVELGDADTATEFASLAFRPSAIYGIDEHRQAGDASGQREPDARDTRIRREESSSNTRKLPVAPGGRSDRHG